MNDKKLSLTIVVVGLSALAASCTGVPAIPTPPTPQPTANTVPTVSTTQTASAPTGEFVSGIITFAGEPLPGARAELRVPGWQTNAVPAVASAVAGPDGVYQMEHPPVGDYSMIGIFPDGQIDAAAYPPVVITAGQTITGIDITLEKALTLVAPAAGAQVEVTPTLRWKGMPEAAKYRVWVVDAGTTELLLDQTVTDTALVVTASLAPGRTYDWVVNAFTAKDISVGALTSRFAVIPSADTQVNPGVISATDGLPPSCQTKDPQYTPYTDAQQHYCFLFPARFKTAEAGPTEPVLYGPDLDQSVEPLRATLLVEVETPAGDETLAQHVDTYVGQFEGLNVPAITRQPITLGGVPAELLEVVPGREGSRDIFALNDGTLYHLMFMPSVRDFPQAKADVEALYEALTGSFTFLR